MGLFYRLSLLKSQFLIYNVLMQKILSIFGTRPEAIKMAPLVNELKQHKGIKSVVCITAQHRDMLDQVLKIFKIKPDYDLNMMKPDQTLSDITTRVIKGIEEVIIKEKPDLVLVHGDTTTAMAGALAAFYQQTKVGHVEAGLRTHDKYSPFPEEINRQIIDQIADYLFAPTRKSRKNLGKKHNKDQKIFITGNTAIDALQTTVSSDYHHPVFDWVGRSKMILLTAHRRENLGDPMRRIFKAIKKITEEFDNVKVVYPVHLNPKVQEVAQEIFGDSNKVKLIEPLDVFDFHNFMKKAHIILSDSGGVQEEAPSLGTPVLVLRNTTERPEGVRAGTLKLVGTSTKKVYSATKKLLNNKYAYRRMAKAKNPYGDGHASKYIVDHILEQEKSI